MEESNWCAGLLVTLTSFYNKLVRWVAKSRKKKKARVLVEMHREWERQQNITKALRINRQAHVKVSVYKRPTSARIIGEHEEIPADELIKVMWDEPQLTLAEI